MKIVNSFETISHVIMYGSDTLALRKAEKNLLERTEIRMLIWMIGIKKIEKTEDIRARAGMVNVIEKIMMVKNHDGNKADWEDRSGMKKQEQKQCGKHKWENKRSETEMVRPCDEKDWRRCSNEKMEVGGHQKIWRPKLRWSDVIKKDMKEKEKIEETQDRRMWRLKTRCTDSK